MNSGILDCVVDKKVSLVIRIIAVFLLILPWLIGLVDATGHQQLSIKSTAFRTASYFGVLVGTIVFSIMLRALNKYPDKITTYHILDIFISGMLIVIPSMVIVTAGTGAME